MIGLDRENYVAVLRELKQERDDLESSLSDVEGAISVFQRKLDELDARSKAAGQLTLPNAQVDLVSDVPEILGPFSGLSMRWAVLWYLSEVSEPLPTPRIALALSRGGITSKSANFISNVSAVLSSMTRDRGEVSLSEGKWQITEKGRSAWQHIQQRRELDPSYGMKASTT